MTLSTSIRHGPSRSRTIATTPYLLAAPLSKRLSAAAATWSSLPSAFAPLATASGHLPDLFSTAPACGPRRKIRVPVRSPRPAIVPAHFTAGLLTDPLQPQVLLNDFAANPVNPTFARNWSSSCSLNRVTQRRRTVPLYPPAPASRRQFSSSYPAMVATKLDGTAIAKKIRERLATDIAEKQKLNPRYQPSLKIIQGKQ
jgi:hypothetical protein